MTLGERLKQLRADKNWTQPQAAESIGIEQSYLSKLENDRSLPSAEILNSILNSYSMSAQTFLEGIDLSRLDRQLMQIPAIAACLSNNQQIRTSTIRKWLLSSALACVLGFTAISAGHLGLVFANKQYSYVSAGVVKPGESQLIFDNWEENMRLPSGGYPSGSLDAWRDAIIDNQQEMARRLEEDYILTSEYKGEIFVLPAEGGSRTYKLMPQTEDDKEVLRKENRVMMLVGFLLAFGGLIGFFVEHRLRKAGNV